MATKNWTESEIKSLIRDVLKQELKDLKSSIEDVKKLEKTHKNESEVKEIVRTTIVNMYKILWQKSNNYIKQI